MGLGRVFVALAASLPANIDGVDLPIAAYDGFGNAGVITIG
jgi:hypothetical protein